MNRNQEIITAALMVSAIYGAAVTVILNIISATYTATMPGGSDIEILTGIQAIQAQIEALGFTQYLLSLMLWYAVIFGVIMVGCLLHAYWLRKNS